MEQRFADLHCHPGLYGFHRMRNNPRFEQNPRQFHPWREFPSDVECMRRGERASTYCQSNFARLAHSNTRLVFASITPLERGFFEGSREEAHGFGRRVVELLSGVTAARCALYVARGQLEEAAIAALGVARSRGPVRALLHRAFMKYGIDRINYLLSDQYDYWDEFLREYAFFERSHGREHHTEIERPCPDGCTRESVSGRYQLVENARHLRRILSDGGDDIAVLPSIEGGHVFSIGPDGRRVDRGLIFERIRTLKSLPAPIFYVTLAHHFDNGICGHARSLIDAARLLMDQSRRMHRGFERDDELGLRVVRELLDLDENLVDRGGRRILIDVKHMSPRSRQEYYDRIVRPYNARHAQLGADEGSRLPKIPVLMSHAGHSGIATLEALARNAPREDDHWHRNPFYAWGLNSSDEDIRMIHRSEGLYGVIFDQRILGVPPNQKVPERQCPHILLNQIFGVVDVIMNDDRLSEAEKRTIWDRVCIGSDFDGMIDPLSRYATALSLPQFARELRELLWRNRHTRMIAQIGVDQLVDKICWRNAYEFARRHLEAASRGG